jgi:hypothetical protein
VLGVEPLALFDVDPAEPSFTALRMAAGLTLQALSDATGISYTLRPWSTNPTST